MHTAIKCSNRNKRKKKLKCTMLYFMYTESIASENKDADHVHYVVNSE